MADESPGSGGKGGGSFFTTLPGILTGLAAVITASATLAGILVARDGGGEATPAPPGTEITPPAPPPPPPPPPPPAGPTRGEWARAANAVCRRATAATTSQALALQQAQTVDQMFAASSQIVQTGLGMVDEIRALDAPPGDRAQIDRMLDGWAEVFRTVQDAVQAAAAQDVNAFTTAYARTANLAEGANAIARDLGADACATTMRDFEQFG